MAIPIYIGLHYGQNERQSSSQTRRAFMMRAVTAQPAATATANRAEKSAHLPTARFMICLLDCRARLSQSQSATGSATGTRLCSHHLRIFRSNKINKNALILCSLSKHAASSSFFVPPTLYPANICTGYAILMTSTKDRRASAASASASAKSSASSH